jgi:secretion/DNA translocation related TadE-like protein
MSRLVSRKEERGSTTLLAVMLLGLLTAVTLGASSVGAVLVGQRQAAAAADLAALAGAAAAQRGADPCVAATRIASDNGASLTGCARRGETVTVTVELAAHTPVWPSVPVSAEARAGPV